MKYQNYRQGNRSVDEYTNEFYHLHIRNNMDEPKFRTITKYSGGLKQKLQDEIIDAIWDMSTMVPRAKKLEEKKQHVISIAQ